MQQGAEIDVGLVADPEGRRGARIIAQRLRKIVFPGVVDTFCLNELHDTVDLTALVSMGIREFLRAGVFITGQAASLYAGPALFLTFCAFFAPRQRLVIRCTFGHGACGGEHLHPMSLSPG